MDSLLIKAVELLKAGELVAFPTETVYGLGADARNEKAVKKIFALKGRPADHPVIIHLARFDQIQDWVTDIPELAKTLAKYFWPGPMTLIFKAKTTVSRFITGGQETIGIRMPAHPLARELLTAFGGALAAPSANRFGRISPTIAAHVKDEFGDEIQLILDGGASDCGLESTIIDVTVSPPQLLRPGPLSVEIIEKISGVKVVEKAAQNTPRVSGSLDSHYAPTTPLYLMYYRDILSVVKAETNIAVVSFHEKPLDIEKSIAWIVLPYDSVLVSHDLYALLRKLDKLQKDKIFFELPENTIEWQAVRDRLSRASIKA